MGNTIETPYHNDLFRYCIKGEIQKLEYYINKADFDRRMLEKEDDLGRTLLIASIISNESNRRVLNKTKVVTILLKRGANVNHACKRARGWTALHFACSVGDVDVVKVLLEFGADPRIKDFSALTPLEVVSSPNAAIAFVQSEKPANAPLPFAEHQVDSDTGEVTVTQKGLEKVSDIPFNREKYKLKVSIIGRSPPLLFSEIKDIVEMYARNTDTPDQSMEQFTIQLQPVKKRKDMKVIREGEPLLATFHLPPEAKEGYCVQLFLVGQKPWLMTPLLGRFQRIPPNVFDGSFMVDTESLTTGRAYRAVLIDDSEKVIASSGTVGVMPDVFGDVIEPTEEEVIEAEILQRRRSDSLNSAPSPAKKALSGSSSSSVHDRRMGRKLSNRRVSFGDSNSTASPMATKDALVNMLIESGTMAPSSPISVRSGSLSGGSEYGDEPPLVPLVLEGSPIRPVIVRTDPIPGKSHARGLFPGRRSLSADSPDSPSIASNLRRTMTPPTNAVLHSNFVEIMSLTPVPEHVEKSRHQSTDTFVELEEETEGQHSSDLHVF